MAGGMMRHARVLTRMSRLMLLIPLIQFGGCTVDALGQSLAQGVIQSVATQVFLSAQTIFLNVFGV